MGWKEGRERMSDELDMAHNATSFERLPSFDYDVAGYMPNIPLYVSGCPSHMMSPLGNESSMGRVGGVQGQLEYICKCIRGDNDAKRCKHTR